MQVERGVIGNRAYKQQIADFSGLTFGKITPTDLDAFMDFNNKLFVFVETKFNNAPLKYGQRLALERLCDACHNPPHRYAVAFVTSHQSNGDIDFANTTVMQFRWNGEWHGPRKEGAALVDGVKAFHRAYVQSNVVPFKKGD